MANIGAGHAATALSQMTGQPIMISVPRSSSRAVEEIPNQVSDGEEPVAAVLMQMLGDLTGLTLLVFPRATALRVAALMMTTPVGTTELGELEQSAIKEAGNILSAAYLNALSEFMGMILLLAAAPRWRSTCRDAVLSRRTSKSASGTDLRLLRRERVQPDRPRTSTSAASSCCCPTSASLTPILRAIRVA